MPDSIVTEMHKAVQEETGKRVVSLSHLYMMAMPKAECLGCGETKPSMFTVKGPRKFCSHHCLNTSEAAWDLRKDSTRRRFGSENVFGSDWFKANRSSIYEESLGYSSPMKDPKIRKKVRSTNLKNWGVPCHFQSEEIKSRIRATNRRLYGSDNVMHNDQVKQNLRTTVQSIYGHDCVLSSEDVQSRIKKTMKRRYGVENPFYDQESLVTPKVLKKFGVTNMAATSEVKEKIRETFKAKYGGHPAQNAEWAESHASSGFAHRRWLSTSGRSYRIQGYEDRVLSSLDRQGWQLETSKSEMPYLEWSSSDGKRRRYYPDVLARKGKRCILVEVKSTWTLFGTQYGKSLETNLLKFRSASLWCRKNNVDFYLVIVVKGSMIRLKNPTRNEVLKTVKRLKSK